MILVPADFGQRHTARPRVRPQPPAPAFVNDEARAVRGTSSMRRLVKGIRRADSTFPDGSDVLLLFALVLDNALSGAW